MQAHQVFGLPFRKERCESSDEVGLARTPDGVLHLVWQRRAANTTAFWHSRIGVDGRQLGAEPIAPGLSDGTSPALTAGPDGALRAFFFLRAADGATADLRFAAAPAGVWSVASAPLAQVAGSIPTAGAASERDGTPVVAWADGGQVRYRFGVDPATQVLSVGAGGCCALGATPAVDQVSGQAYVAWAGTAAGSTGIFVEAIDRAGATRPKVFATGSANKKRNAAVLPDARVALTARSGAARCLPRLYDRLPQGSGDRRVPGGGAQARLDPQGPGRRTRRARLGAAGAALARLGAWRDDLRRAYEP